MRILALGLMLAALILAGTVLLYVRRWSAGRPAKVDWLAGIARLPRAYLHDVHEVVARESLAGGMHALTAGGLLASLVLLLLMAWGGWQMPSWYSVVVIRLTRPTCSSTRWSGTRPTRVC